MLLLLIEPHKWLRVVINAKIKFAKFGPSRIVKPIIKLEILQEFITHPSIWLQIT